MAYSPNYQPPKREERSSDDNTYISGYGFVSTDPRLLQEQHLKKDVAVISAAMVGVLLLPTLLLIPVTAGMQAVVNTLSRTTNQVVLITTFAQETRELILYLLSILLPIFFLRFFLKDAQVDTVVRRLPGKKLWCYAVPLTLTVVALSGVGSRFLNDLLSDLHIVSLTPNNMLPGNTISLVFYMIRVMFLPALLEEYLFRGLILHSLRRYGDTFAVVLSSAFYGMMQYTVIRNLSGFVFGLVLGYFVLRTGSLLTAVVGHLCTSAVNSVIILTQHFLPSHYELVENIIFILILVAGIVSFILLCTRESNAFIMSDTNNTTSTAHKLKLCFGNMAFIALLILWAWQMLGNIQII